MWAMSVFLLVLILLTARMGAIMVDVPSGKVKCLTEDLRKGTLSYAQYRVVNASAAHLTISARVSDPNGDALHHSESVESGHFYFEVATAGRHTACFWSPKFELTASLSVDVEWTAGIRSHGARPGVTKQGTRLEQMGTELKKLEDAIRLIHDEMIFLRDREMDAHRLNQDTASKMTSLTLFSLLICLAVASLQLWHLNTFFHTKKIL